MVAGEASGDLLAAHLIRAIRNYLPDAVFFGIGGPRMEAEGFQSYWAAEHLSVHGYVDALKNLRKLSDIRRKALQKILENTPAAFIGVDAPDFNLWLEEKVKARGIPSIHFVSPSIWAWRGGRIKRIARSVSQMLCLFPFEPPFYEKAGVPVTYVGHPLADELPVEPDRDAARRNLGISPDVPVVAVLPGSRQSEVRHLASTYLQTMILLRRQHPEIEFLVPLATPETFSLFKEALRHQQAHTLPVTLLDGRAVDAMTAADAVLVTSGTASLEAALLKRPMVISYRMASWQYRIARFFNVVYLPWVGLPNILCNEKVVPELLQDEATPENLCAAIENWLNDAPARKALEARFHILHQELRQNTAEKAAKAVLPYLCREKQ